MKKTLRTSQSPKAIKEPMNRSALTKFIAEQANLSAAQARAALAAIEVAALASLSKKGCGLFTLPGLLKLQTVKVPAKPKRTGINPFTKEQQVFAAKPATVKVKVRTLKRLKDAALS